MNRRILLLFPFFLLIIAGCQQAPVGNVIKIGCAAPLTGDQAQIGIDTCRGVELAIAQANTEGKIPGFTLAYTPADDQHNPSQAVNIAKKFVSDRGVIGVVGHFNSSCTKPASAIYESSGMVMVTPGSTNPELSQQGFKTFFRVAATDNVQGPQGAQYAAHALGIKTVFVIDDKTTYGKGLADAFEVEAKALGIQVLGHEGITQGDKDFTPLLTKIKPLAPDLIYFGGIYPEGALLVRQARGLDIASIFMGGDGLAEHTFVKLASAPIAEGVYTTMVGGDMRKVASAAGFIAEYEAKYGKLGQWSAYGYDAANIIIASIQKAENKDRKSVLKAIREIPSFAGVTGEIRFDENGDNQNQFIGIFKFTNGELTYIGPAKA